VTELDRLSNRVRLVESELKRVRQLYASTLRHHQDEPAIALAQARKAAEAICKQLYAIEGCQVDGKPGSKMALNDLIQALNRRGILPSHIRVALQSIRDFGNLGAHDQGPQSEYITAEYVRPCLHALASVVEWYLRDFHRQEDRLQGVEGTIPASFLDQPPTEQRQLLELFGRGFHRRDDSLEGRWTCDWFDGDGQLLTRDEVDLVMSDTVVRGIAKTGGRLGPEHYPLEGRLSAERMLALVYWSVAPMAACGVAMLRVAPSGRKMIGQWTGHTMDDPDAMGLRLVSGQSIWARVSED
jgi:hypothetical protein